MVIGKFRRLFFVVICFYNTEPVFSGALYSRQKRKKKKPNKNKKGKWAEKTENRKKKRVSHLKRVKSVGNLEICTNFNTWFNIQSDVYFEQCKALRITYSTVSH